MSKPTENTITKDDILIHFLMGKFYEDKLPTRDEADNFKKLISEIFNLIKTEKIAFIEIMKFEAIQDFLLEHGLNNEKVNDEILILKGLKKREEKIKPPTFDCHNERGCDVQCENCKGQKL